MNKLNFSTIGTFGDTIYSLCLVKILGGGNLYVKLDALDNFAKNVIGWPNAGEASGRYTQQDYDIIEPLLKAQSYISEVDIWANQQLDREDMHDHWKYHLLRGWQGNQTECYALAMGMDIHDRPLRNKLLYEPWLDPVAPLQIAGKPIVINRTTRHLHGAGGDQWNTWVDNSMLGEYSVFIGTDEEHSIFEDKFKVTVYHQRINDLLEMARYIQGAELFIGNQSSALSIAIGLGKTYWCEVRDDYEQTKTPHGGYGDVWFPRINGLYF